MNNKLSIFNMNSVLGHFQLWPDFFKYHWQKISIVLAIGFGIVITNIIFIQSTRATPFPSSESPLLTVQTRLNFLI